MRNLIQGVIGIDKFIRDIIQKLININGYNVMEVDNIKGIRSSWIAVKDMGTFYNIVGFSDEFTIGELNKDYFRSYVESLIIEKPIKLAIAILTDKPLDNYLMNSLENLTIRDISFIIDYKNRNIIYAGEETENIVEDIIKVPEQRKAVYHNESVNNGNKKPFATYSIIGINIFMYIITALLSHSIFNSDIRVLVFLGAKVNYFITNGQYYRLITAMFLHGGLIHLALNMYALNSIGPLVESYFGRIKYLIIYFISGILGSYFSYLFSASVSIGASGAIFGIFGSTLIVAYRNRKTGGKEFLRNIISVIVVNLILGFSIPNVDNFGHIGGLIGGIISTLVIVSLFNKKNV